MIAFKSKVLGLTSEHRCGQFVVLTGKITKVSFQQEPKSSIHYKMAPDKQITRDSIKIIDNFWMSVQHHLSSLENF